MSARNVRRPRVGTASEMHREWLELVETDGPFLAVPPLKRVWPQGMPSLDAAHKDALSQARKEFLRAWEAVDRFPDDEAVLGEYQKVRDAWVETVLRDVAGWQESLVWQPTGVPGVSATSPDRRVMISAQAALRRPDGEGYAALVHLVDPVDSLQDTGRDGWAASPVDRLEAMLREAKVEIGLVTDGRWWGLVAARPGAMTASGIVDALTWVEEPRVRDAFLTLITRRHLAGGAEDERLPSIFAESVTAAEEITEALGAQVRRAVELLIQSFAESAADSVRRGLPDPLPARPQEAYEAAVTVMMRVVFLLFAEERNLLPQGELWAQGYGIAGELDELEHRQAERTAEGLDSTFLTWHRLLATSQALFAGATFEGLRMPAYGGSLFDPARFPFLTALTEHGTLAVSVPDRVMLHVLRAVQRAELKGQPPRRISFRDIDVEQIGYIYEGLLGYTCVRADQVYLGLRGAAGAEPEIPLTTLEELAARHRDPKRLAAEVRAWALQDQPGSKPRSVAALAQAVTDEVDPSVMSALRQSVGDDEQLRRRLQPYAGIIRLDLRGRPFVVLTGGLLVKETPSRRNSGTHYTPKSLAEEVVLHALQPTCYAPGPHQTADSSQWRLKSSDELLNLKVADIAAGSGAFLVAAARYLADRVAEAWVEEDAANADRSDLQLHAIREVVANCLYGADINEMAVEMCKLSLWLVSLDRDLPFSFVDDKILHGNSLLGLTSLDQLRALHIDPTRVSADQRFDIFDVDVDAIVRRAVEIRRALASEVDERDPARSSAAKRRLLDRLHDVTADLRRIADGVIATGLPLGGKPGRALDEAYENLRLALKAAYPDVGDPDPRHLDAITDSGLTPTVPTDNERWKPLHWVLEVPDVVVDRGGFDAVIGNPPFLGGSKISGANGVAFRDWLANRVAGAPGNADLVGYFVLRAWSLLRSGGGSFGLIATNSIAQGDTREVALDPRVGTDIELSRAVQSAAWPASSVTLEYAAVWGTNGSLAPDAMPWCDGATVSRISSLLEPEGRVTGKPRRLLENRQQSFYGCKIDGAGFLLTPEEAADWIAADSGAVDVLRPYLSGEDVNGRPDHAPSRWVIDFNDWPYDKAARYPQAMARLEERVRSIRAKNNKIARRERWWQYGENAPGLRRGLAKSTQVLVFTRVSKTVMPVRVGTGLVFSDSLAVLLTSTYADQAVLSSSSHTVWAIKYGSGLRTDPRYTPADVFETFPRPKPTEWLERIGRTLDEERRETMLRRQLGLTKLYNLVNDPDITDASDPDVKRMREIHVELDHAVMEAYGWSDVPLDHGFHTYRQMERWTVSPAARVEILDRLLDENLRRAAAEAEAGARKPKRGRRKADQGQEAMFG